MLTPVIARLQKLNRLPGATSILYTDSSKTRNDVSYQPQMWTIQSPKLSLLAAFLASCLRLRWRAMSTIGRSFFWSYSPGGSTIESCRKLLMPSSMSLRLSAMYAISWNLYMIHTQCIIQKLFATHLALDKNSWRTMPLCNETVV